jgi:hypothetical protein
MVRYAHPTQDHLTVVPSSLDQRCAMAEVSPTPFVTSIRLPREVPKVELWKTVEIIS